MPKVNLKKKLLSHEARMKSVQ